MDNISDELGPWQGMGPVVLAARQCATAAGHSEISSLHLLLGLLTTHTSLFQSLGVETPVVQARLRERLVPGGSPSSSELGFDDSAGRAMANATEEAGGCGAHTIRIEHLLLGLLSECAPAWEATCGAPVGDLTRRIRDRLNQPEKASEVTPTNPPHSEAQRAVGLAFAAARSLQEPVDVAHLVRAVVELDSPGMQQVLADLNLDVEQVRSRITSAEPAQEVPEHSRSFTARARRVLDAAEAIATQAGRQEVEIGDLFRAAWAELSNPGSSDSK